MPQDLDSTPCFFAPVTIKGAQVAPDGDAAGRWAEASGKLGPYSDRRQETFGIQRDSCTHLKLRPFGCSWGDFNIKLNSRCLSLTGHRPPALASLLSIMCSRACHRLGAECHVLPPPIQASSLRTWTASAWFCCTRRARVVSSRHLDTPSNPQAAGSTRRGLWVGKGGGLSCTLYCWEGIFPATFVAELSSMIYKSLSGPRSCDERK